MRFVVGILAILSLSLSAQANTLPTSLVLYDGDVRVLSAPGVERVAVGNVDLISATLLTLLVLPALYVRFGRVRAPSAEEGVPVGPVHAAAE